jgi:hypothetical protein
MAIIELVNDTGDLITVTAVQRQRIFTDAKGWHAPGKKPKRTPKPKPDTTDTDEKDA